MLVLHIRRCRKLEQLIWKASSCKPLTCAWSETGVFVSLPQVRPRRHPVS